MTFRLRQQVDATCQGFFEDLRENSSASNACVSGLAKNQIPSTIGGPIRPWALPRKDTTGTAMLNSSGFFGGGQAGFNWQAGTRPVPAWTAILTPRTLRVRPTSSATLFGRRGTTDSVRDGARPGRLPRHAQRESAHGNCGWAYGQTTSSASAAAFGPPAAASVGHEKNGWTAGGGFEYAFNPCSPSRPNTSTQSRQ